MKITRGGYENVLESPKKESPPSESELSDMEEDLRKPPEDELGT